MQSKKESYSSRAQSRHQKAILAIRAPTARGSPPRRHWVLQTQTAMSRCTKKLKPPSAVLYLATAQPVSNCPRATTMAIIRIALQREGFNNERDKAGHQRNQGSLGL